MAALVGFAVAWRAVAAARTPVPSEDGVTYLWMAERFAAGDAGAALGEVFGPLPSLGVAALIALGIEPFRAAQALLAGCGALAVPILGRLAVCLGAATPWPAACLAAAAAHPVRLAAEVYSEPVFVLLGGAAMLAAAAGRSWTCGVLCGAAAWTRPEAAILAAALAATHRAGALRIAAAWAAAVALLACWRGALGHGFDPLPKLAFNWDKAALLGGETASCLGNALALPRLWLEAFAVFGVVALLGLWSARGALANAGRAVLALGVVLVLAFVARRRFLVGWLFVVVPFAGAGLGRLRPGWARAVLAAALAVELALGLRTTDPDRAAEREVGRWLRGELAAGEEAASDLTRVLYFAGQRPLPPRHVTADELVEWAERPGVTRVVLGSRRAHAAAVRARLADRFAERPLPPGLNELAAARGLVVLQRR
jgi:hypothetical protein